MTQTRPRILFVDDEPMILTGLRNGLRRHAARWDMSFAANAEEALAQLASAGIAVLVSDMRMPGMDGVALLETVRASSAHTTRILLTGYADPDAMASGAMVAHQLLRKPCPLATIALALERGCRLDAVLRDPATAQIAAECVAIAPPASVYGDVARALAYPELPAVDISASLANDPTTCARILALCTPSFGFDRAYTTAAEAVVQLGPELIGPLALASHLWAALEPFVEPRSLREAQLHGLEIAHLARPLDRVSASETFTCSLVHDVGKLLLEQRAPAAYAAVVARAAATGTPQHVVEREVFGTTHGELIARLLAGWGVALPILDALIEAATPAAAGSLAAALATAHDVADHLVRRRADGSCSSRIPIVSAATR
ncbi:MAG: response regulator [Myxococcota bacterium]|nr:response regulator [Myxococcota bacterium]